MSQKVLQTDSALCPGPYGESMDFWVFLKSCPPCGGQPEKSILRFPTGTMGYLMPNLVEISPVVWAPNPNKKTDTSLLYIYIDNISLRTKYMLSTWIKRKQKRYLWLCESKKNKNTVPVLTNHYSIKRIISNCYYYAPENPWSGSVRRLCPENPLSKRAVNK